MNDPAEFEFFTDSWLQAWADEIGRSTAYQQAAATWEGSLVFRLRGADDGGDVNTAVFLDLWHGACRDARYADADDQAQADYIMEATLPVWKGLMAGKTQPLMALMTGKLKLVRGSLSALTPYVQASQELVAAASRVPTRFPAA